MNDDIAQLLAFYKKAEKLKSTLRHSWTTETARQESTAEHSWMLGLLTMILAEKLTTPVDVFKTLKMVLVHDLAEAITGDIPAHEISDRQQTKVETERAAFEQLTQHLSPALTAEVVELWEEFEARQTPEAKFAVALDKLEAVLQHNAADISTWDGDDFAVHPYYKNECFDFDPFFRALKDVADTQSMEKIIDAKLESRVDPKHLERHRKNKQ
jgi:putative hydrolase of HD superfamily